jgi:hypothetical protein
LLSQTLAGYLTRNFGFPANRTVFDRRAKPGAIVDFVKQGLMTHSGCSGRLRLPEE